MDMIPFIITFFSPYIYTFSTFSAFLYTYIITLLLLEDFSTIGTDIVPTNPPKNDTKICRDSNEMARQGTMSKFTMTATVGRITTHDSPHRHIPSQQCWQVGPY